MKIILSILFIILFFNQASARELGETEITTEDGIEVFQDQKFYLLKKNVKIKSDDFNLNADNVKISFNKNLYDIVSLKASGKVIFDSSKYKMNGRGEELDFNVKEEELKIEGLRSKLNTEEIEMLSDGFVKVNNLSGKFTLNGANSELKNTIIQIEAEYIDGVFVENLNGREISFLNVLDKQISYIKNNETEMFAKKINFDNNTSIIELFENVKIIRDGQTIIGDYGTLDTKNNSYKIKSNNKTKVKAIIQNNE